MRYVGPDPNIHNKTGTVVVISCSRVLGVCFDEYIQKCHNLSGLCDNGHGWWCSCGNIVCITEWDDGEVSDASAENMSSLMELLE